MDIRPLARAGRQIVESYGGGRFRVSGRAYEGSVLVLPERTLPRPVTAIEALSLDSLAPVTAAAAALEVLLIGCGPRPGPQPEDLRGALRGRGLVVEPMDTGAACRTYNVLISAGRPRRRGTHRGRLSPAGGNE